MVQRVEIDVRQQRTEHRSLRRSLLRRPALQAVQDALLQERFEQLQHSSVRHLLRHPLHQPVVRNRVEVALQVGIHDPGVALPSAS